MKHTDGTSWCQAGVLCALWTAAPSAVAVFEVLTDVRAATIAPLFGRKLGTLLRAHRPAVTVQGLG